MTPAYRRPLIGCVPGACAATAIVPARASSAAPTRAWRKLFIRIEYPIMDEQTLSPSQLWKRMTSDQRLQVAKAFWLDQQATDDQLQAVLVISQRKNFRPKTVVSLDEDRKARHLASLGSLPDHLAAR